MEHIGSTSVPGLAAKPIIDMLLTVAVVEDEAAYVPPLVDAGFVLRVREPRHRMLRAPDEDVHLHVCEPADQSVADYLDLRDWLRVSASDRALYAAVKRDLAQRAWVDMNDYADAKTDVVLDVLGRARAWRKGCHDEAARSEDVPLASRRSTEGKCRSLPLEGCEPRQPEPVTRARATRASSRSG